MFEIRTVSVDRTISFFLLSLLFSLAPGAALAPAAAHACQPEELGGGEWVSGRRRSIDISIGGALPGG
jgi:hypothetical protein